MNSNISTLYETVFARLKDSAENVMIIGISDNEPLKSWYGYFGMATIHGLYTRSIPGDVKSVPRVNALHINPYDENNIPPSSLISPSSYDVIIDNGPRDEGSIMFFARHYSKLLTPHGISVIQGIRNVDWLFDIMECFPSEYRQYVKLHNVQEEMVLILDKSIIPVNIVERETLVLYVYHESEMARKNLEFFNKFGLYDQRATYVLIINSPVCSVKLSDRWSKQIYRENVGIDFGGWYDALTSMKEELPHYKYFVFMNDTVRGPFGDRNWIKTFTGMITERTKLSGISINTLSRPWFTHPFKRKSLPHVQSMFMCTDQVGLSILYPAVINDTMYAGKMDTIIRKEVGTSIAILDAGYNITCILPQYQLNYLDPNIVIADSHRNPDIWSSPTTHIHPYQTIFFKASCQGQQYPLDYFTQLQNQITYY